MTPARRMKAHRPRPYLGQSRRSALQRWSRDTGGEQRNRRERKSPAGREDRAAYFNSEGTAARPASRFFDNGQTGNGAWQWNCTRNRKSPLRLGLHPRHLPPLRGWRMALAVPLGTHPLPSRSGGEVPSEARRRGSEEKAARGPPTPFRLVALTSLRPRCPSVWLRAFVAGKIKSLTFLGLWLTAPHLTKGDETSIEIPDKIPHPLSDWPILPRPRGVPFMEKDEDHVRHRTPAPRPRHQP
jgi:hypothetical protein